MYCDIKSELPISKRFQISLVWSIVGQTVHELYCDALLTGESKGILIVDVPFIVTFCYSLAKWRATINLINLQAK